MTIETDSSSIVHIATGEDTFAYDFRVDEKDDMNLSIDGIPYLGGFTITGLKDPQGGTVTFDTAPPNNSRVILFRVVPLTQVIDYRDYDAFPAETHELALDRLTMIAQQQDEQIKDSLRYPPGDPGVVELPPSAERAEKFLYFDSNGDATVIEADPDAVAVLSVLIEDGETGPDSRTMLRVSTARGAQNPRIGVNNINQPHGILQLDQQGFVPFENLKISGITVRGPYRGDNLCPKPGDDPADCTAPDHRNPSQRFTNLAAQFSNGDTFLITMEDPEILGQMELYESLGDTSMQVLDVEKGDAVIYLDATDGSGNPLPSVQEGWYLVKRIVDFTSAEFVSHDDTDNEYVLGTNVQAALNSTDDALKDANDALKDANDAIQGNALGIVPVGGIIPYYGAWADIPDNWQLCDGTNGTPELMSGWRAIIGCGLDEGNVGVTGGSAAVALPSHAHTMAHTHNMAHTHIHGLRAETFNYAGATAVGSDGGGIFIKPEPNAQGGRGSQGATGGASVANTGGSSAPNTGAAGVDASGANYPPYVAMAWIMRIS